ncbi:peptidoglycan DD-metalloendopeptidase family protein [Neisseria sp. WLZKY-1]|uniref:peptidoglycan DD-metalloendopeptidase family protein n=1 Tax=Neisseria sp. WLZKY-1 TaxID=3390377 RepID=UPI00397B52EE
MKTPLPTPLKTFSAAALLLLAACASQSPSDGYYRVRPGDTLHRIAARVGQSPATLAKWNKLSDPSKITVGQMLRVGKNAPRTSDTAAGQSRPVPQTNKLSMHLPSANPVLARFGGANKGVDFAGSAGDPVKAAAAGKVLYAGNGVRGYGNLVLISHGGGVLTAYAHNDKLLVQKDQTVRAGDTVALMGSSDAERVKLHFEVRAAGKAVNPENYLPPLPASAAPTPVPFPVPAAPAQTVAAETAVAAETEEPPPAPAAETPAAE